MSQTFLLMVGEHMSVKIYSKELNLVSSAIIKLCNSFLTMHVTICSVDLTTKLGSHGFVNVEHYHSCGIFLWICFSKMQNTVTHFE